MLDMQEVTGSSPVSPTTHRFRARQGSFNAHSADSVSTALRDRLTARVGSRSAVAVRLLYASARNSARDYYAIKITPWGKRAELYLSPVAGEPLAVGFRRITTPQWRGIS